MGTVKRKFYSELWKADIFLNSSHCLCPNVRVADISDSFGKTFPLRRSVHFLIWSPATKCSLVFKYILRFTGNLKKKSVPEQDCPDFSFTVSFPFVFLLFRVCYIAVLVWNVENETRLWMNLCCVYAVSIGLLGPSAFLNDSERSAVKGENADQGIPSSRCPPAPGVVDICCYIVIQCSKKSRVTAIRKNPIFLSFLYSSNFFFVFYQRKTPHFRNSFCNRIFAIHTFL